VSASRFRHRAAACCLALAAALAVSACGASSQRSAAAAENNGVYVTLDGISYQLQVSRELNQYATEDSQYLAGVSSSDATLSPDQIWYGVFLRAVNSSHRNQTSSATFKITDTQASDDFTPVQASNPYAWKAQTLAPGDTQPTPDSTASLGPTQGGLVLFKLPTAVYANRPLTLTIQGSGGPSDTATISLDL
jgi:hypothetical protein